MWVSHVPFRILSSALPLLGLLLSGSPVFTCPSSVSLLSLLSTPLLALLSVLLSSLSLLLSTILLLQLFLPLFSLLLLLPLSCRCCCLHPYLPRCCRCLPSRRECSYLICHRSCSLSCLCCRLYPCCLILPLLGCLIVNILVSVPAVVRLLYTCC